MNSWQLYLKLNYNLDVELESKLYSQLNFQICWDLNSKLMSQISSQTPSSELESLLKSSFEKDSESL